MNIELSKNQLRTLLYWAHRGASDGHGHYSDVYPDRDTPYQKIRKIEDKLKEQGFYRL